jgi:ubiquinone/menaquinone biosynthesis C-methylase UbiE
MDYDVIIEQGRSKENDAIIKYLVPKCVGKVLDIKDKLPFEDKTFDTVVLSCVLEQCDDWEKVLIEALRVCKEKVIGINPIPEKSPWGFVGGWVKSVIKPDYLKSFYGATIQYPDIAGKYYFEIFAQ